MADLRIKKRARQRRLRKGWQERKLNLLMLLLEGLRGSDEPVWNRREAERRVLLDSRLHDYLRYCYLHGFPHQLNQLVRQGDVSDDR